jgi:hypothetical protein
VLISFVVSIIPTIFSVVYIRPTISFVIYVVPPASVVLTLIFVKEMRGERSLIPHVSHLFLGDVPSVIISGPVAWAGLLLFLATGVTDFFFIPAMVVYRPCHVNIE